MFLYNLIWLFNIHSVYLPAYTCLQVDLKKLSTFSSFLIGAPKILAMANHAISIAIIEWWCMLSSLWWRNLVEVAWVLGQFNPIPLCPYPPKSHNNWTPSSAISFLLYLLRPLRSKSWKNRIVHIHIQIRILLRPNQFSRIQALSRSDTVIALDSIIASPRSIGAGGPPAGNGWRRCLYHQPMVI